MMKNSLYIVLFVLFVFALKTQAQTSSNGTTLYKVPVIVYKGDTIPCITLRTVYVYPELHFKNKRQRRYYNKLVRDVKKTLPIAKEVKRAVIETYEYLMTLPDE